MEALAPLELAEEWDRIGLQLGHPERRVERMLLALTVTPEVVGQATTMSADLIIAHHPLIFRPLTELRWDQPVGALLQQLIEANIHVYVAHTNYDAAEEGTSQVLADRLGLTEARPLTPQSSARTGFGRVGKLPTPLTPQQFLEHTVAQLGLTHLRHNGRLPGLVQKVAVMGGSGASFVEQAVLAQVDAYVTGDIKFHDALDAQTAEIWTIDAGHFGTERPILPFWKEYLESQARSAGFHLTVAVADETDPFDVTRP